MAHDKKPERTTAPEAKEYHKHHEPQEDVVEVEAEADAPADGQTPARGKHLQLFDWCKTHKKVSIPAATALLLVIFFAIPFTRYAALGLFLKQDFSVVVVDSQTGKPVSSAQVTLKGKTASTDGEGKANVRVAVGEGKLTVSKTYYKPTSQSVVVPVKKPASALKLKLEATGRPVPVTVLNNISGKPLAGAVFSSGKSEAKTDDKGQAVLVVPTNAQEIKATLSAGGYNGTEVVIKVTTKEDGANTFKLTPSGKVYFLSNQSGKLDVVKSDLDGTNRQTVLAGTGKEVKGETVLLATRDWKYLALYSRRDGGQYSKLFLINTTDDSLTTMDEGEAAFTLAGWHGHTFVYSVYRTKLSEWEPKRQAIKSYNADEKKLRTLDQNAAEGTNNSDYKYESFGTIYVVEGRLVYNKYWYGYLYGWLHPNLSSKQATLNSIKPDGSEKQVVKSFDVPNGVELRPYGPAELYVRAGDKKFFEYGEGQLKAINSIDDDTFYNQEYATYLESPSGKLTFWSLDRDGKLAFLVGGRRGEDEKDVARLDSDYQTYGWFTEDYLLISKKGSELYIMPVSGVKGQDQLVKVTDYYRPFYTYRGYGGGYGGL